MGEKEGGVVCSTMEPSQSSSKCCDECKTNAFKYKCPGCSLRSCSLPCVKAHKQRTGCTGKRQQQTDFVPLSQFDDNLLMSDYSMLEDVKRIADSAKRRRVQLCGKYLYGIAPGLKYLLKAAGNRRIRLSFLPNGMSRRETNRTYYRKRCIWWTIEWRFHSTKIKLIDHGVNENSNICSVIENHLKPDPEKHPLKPFGLEPVESLKFLISEHPKQPKSPLRELDVHAPIHEQLANLVIIEYPVIHVLLPSHSLDFKVIKKPVKHQRPPKPKPDIVKDPEPSPKGVIFKEEEIKDQDSSEPHVLDLMNQPNIKTESKDKQLTNDDELGVVDLLNFDFDPELVDIYSTLLSETNPDDFLDFDGLCDDLPLQEEKGECGVVKEELEEGEIADSD